ncbi:MAG: hypothetical protein WDW38_010021 [Sanguina aurantia]
MHVDDDLWGTVRAEGKQERESFRQFLTSAAKQAHTCCACSCDGQATAEGSSSSSGDGGSSKHSAQPRDESTVLRFTTFTSLSFMERSIRYTHAGFACGKCRAMRDVAQFIKCAALRLGPQYPDREQLMKDLSLHFAMLNAAPEAVQVNPDALIVWIQELYSRAYALQVVASNLRGWKMLGPSDQPALFGTAGASRNLAMQLLAAGAKRSEPVIATPAKKLKGSSKAASAAATPLASQTTATATSSSSKAITPKRAHTTAPAPAPAPASPTEAAGAPKSLKKRKSGVVMRDTTTAAVTVEGVSAGAAAVAAAVEAGGSGSGSQTPKRKKLKKAGSAGAEASPAVGHAHGSSSPALTAQQPTSPHTSKLLSGHSKKQLGAAGQQGSAKKSATAAAAAVEAAASVAPAAGSTRPKSAAKGKQAVASQEAEAVAEVASVAPITPAKRKNAAAGGKTPVQAGAVGAGVRKAGTGKKGASGKAQRLSM